MLDLVEPAAEDDDSHALQQWRETHARLMLNLGSPGKTLEAARACERWESHWGTHNPVFSQCPWRSTAALAHLALDDTDAELAPIFAQLRDPAQYQSQTFPPSPGGPLARIERSLSSLLMASEPYEPSAEQAVAYREEMRARGREALALGGRETLDYLAHRLADSAPGRAQVHAAILDVAWRGLTRARL